MDWNRLRIFQTVVETGSFTRAGHTLGLSQPAVSRQVAALEACLGVCLFHRHARGLVLTEAGEDFYGIVRDMSGTLAIGLARVNECREAPKGPLRITTSVAFGSAWLTPRMNEFRVRYPDIAVSLLLVDNVELDLSRREADVAIRFAPQRQMNLVQRHLMTIRYHVFASEEYLRERGVPQSAEDLDQHQIIVYGEEVPAPVADMNWLLEAGTRGGAKREPAVAINSVYGIYRAVRSGLGIAALPYYLSQEAPNLVEILPSLHGPDMHGYFVYPEELRQSRRVVVVRDFLLEQVRKDAYLREGSARRRATA